MGCDDRMSPRNRTLPARDERRGTDADDHDIVNPLGVGIVTVSSSREATVSKAPTDPSGDCIADVFRRAGHIVTARTLIPDDYAAVQTTLGEFVGRDEVDVVVTTGGTGATIDDVTPTAATDLFDRELGGFAEAFHRLSWDEVGTRAIATRATAGIVQNVPVFVLPGSVNAVRLASRDIIVPEAPHLAGLATRHLHGSETG